MQAGVVIVIPCNDSSPRYHIAALDGSKLIPVTAVPYTPLFFYNYTQLIGKMQVMRKFASFAKRFSSKQQMALDGIRCLTIWRTRPLLVFRIISAQGMSEKRMDSDSESEVIILSSSTSTSI